jgi:alkylated DNA repair dioxygenase AlkB
MNSLFPVNEPINILPKDGTARYFGIVFSSEEAERYFNALMETVEWKNDEAVIFGKKIITKRKIAWYADESYNYTYSGVTRTALKWNAVLLELKKCAEELTGETYNSCLLNLYHDGSEGMAWHSDAEKDLEKHGTIASFSFGAERKFAFKHKTSGEKKEVFLENGSLITMEKETQDFWLHRLPPTTKVKTPRVNLTFRKIRK